MGGEDCIIQVNKESSMMAVARDWVRQTNEQVKELRQSRIKESDEWRAASIYRIPHNLKKPYSIAYQPQVVSIGPYHHGEPQLVGMEKHKHRALLNFLDRTGKSLEHYVEALAPVMQDLKYAYPQLQPEYKNPGSDSFLKMMITDGCFVIELMRTTSSEAVAKAADAYYATNDPVFSSHGKLYLVPLVQRDMLMLENQIPMLLLIKLMEAEGGGGVGKVDDKLTDNILEFFNPPTMNQRLKDEDKRLGNQIRKWGKFLHILDLYRKSLLLFPDKKEKEETCGDSLPKNSFWGKKKSMPPRTVERTVGGRQSSCDCFPNFYGEKSRTVERAMGGKQKAAPSKKKPISSNCLGNIDKHPDLMRSATELTEAGIGFKKSETTYLNDTSYHCGTLKLPRITVDDTSRSLLLNLMAFERLHVGAGTNEVTSEVTSYVFFMDRLIDSAKDVSLLHWNKIIENVLGSDEDVAGLFNSLSTNSCLRGSGHVFELQDEVAEHSRKPGRRWLAYAKHNYFTNPWITLSIIAAILIFALTMVQTVYAVLGYYRKK